MQIIGQAISIPRQTVRNIDVLDEVKAYSKRHLSGPALLRTLQKLQESFEKSGIRSRSRLASDERPSDCIRESFMAATAVAGVSPNRISTLIYCSIHRGYWEPASASIACDALGIRPARAFDVLDACMGWATALEIAHSLLKTGGDDLIAVIAAEFPHEAGGAVFPACYEMKSENDWVGKFAGLTVGEGAATTILARESGNTNWRVVRREEPGLWRLSQVPIRNCGEGALCNGYVDRDVGVGSFFADTGGLLRMGYRPSVQVLRDYIREFGTPDLIIPHSVSTELPIRLAAIMGLEREVFTTYAELGNLASASIPVNLHSAICRGQLRVGMHPVAWIASAGMKFAAFNLPLQPELIMRIAGR